MTRIKALGAVAILCAAIASPAFAHDTGTSVRVSRIAHHKFYHSYNQSNASYAAPMTNEEYWNLQNFGTTGRDRSRVGGEDPDLNPSY